MAEIDDKCGCCGRPGQVIGEGGEARVRCVQHEYVVDVEEWLRARDAMQVAFETEAEMMAYFQPDYGAGLEMMQELAQEEDDDDTRH